MLVRGSRPQRAPPPRQHHANLNRTTKNPRQTAGAHPKYTKTTKAKNPRQSPKKPKYQTPNSEHGTGVRPTCGKRRYTAWMSRGISVRLQDETWERVDKLRVETDSSLTWVVESLLRAGLKMVEAEDRAYGKETAVGEEPGSAGVRTVEEQKRPTVSGDYERCEHGRNRLLCLMLNCRKAREPVEIRSEGVQCGHEQASNGAVSG